MCLGNELTATVVKSLSSSFLQKTCGFLGQRPKSPFAKNGEILFAYQKIRTEGRNFQWTFRPWETQLGGLPNRRSFRTAYFNTQKGG